MSDYEKEVQARWGGSDTYREHREKTKNYSKEKWNDINSGLMALFAEFSACKNWGAAADSDDAQKLVEKLKAYITANYYTCSNEILSGLGDMYTADERFRNTIDKYGAGTAAFAAEAIRIYCRT